MVTVSRNLSDHFSYFLKKLFQFLNYGFQKEKNRCQERLEGRIESLKYKWTKL